MIWAQEHLYGAGYKLAIDGEFGPADPERGQGVPDASTNLPANGVVNGATWNALVKVTPVTVTWTRKKNQRRRRRRPQGAGSPDT